MPSRPAPAFAPTPTEPTAGAVAPLDAVVFRWTAPPGATRFDLRVAAASAPDTPLVELTGLEATEATLADALPPGPALWWVRQADGAWSTPARFIAGTPADVEVAQQAAADASRDRRGPSRPSPVEAPPDPVWPYAEGDALDGAAPLDWATVPGFGAPARPDVPLADAPAPRPVGPLGGEVVDALTLSLHWTAVPGATGYDVEVSPHADFSRDVLQLDAGHTTEIGLAGLVPPAGRKVLWRVRARMGEAATPWSQYGRFYPADDDASGRFRDALSAARTAERRQRDHARRLREQERDLLPYHERGEPATTTATMGVLLALSLTSIVITLLAAAYTLVVP